MHIMDRVRGLMGFNSELKQSAASLFVMSPGQPVWTPRDYDSFAKEAYGRNVVAYQAINKIAEAIASVEFLAFKGEIELDTHPLLDLIERPNPMQSKSDYIIAKIGYLMISGNSYEERVTVGSNIRELYQMRPDRMKVIPSARGVPHAYRHTINGHTQDWEVDPATLHSDLRHLKLFNPTNDWYGMAPVEAGAYAIDQVNEAMAWMQGLLQNSARPSGALVTKGETTLEAEPFARLKQQIETQYSGAKNAGRPMLLEGGLDWKQMGMSPTDMGIIEAKFSAARDVSLAFGVPPQLLGIPGDSTYSNYKEARLAFWEDTVLPLLKMILSDWNAWFGQIYQGITIKANFDEIPAIVEKRLQLWDMADKSTDLTIDERRKIKGYDPLPNGLGAVILVGSAQITLEMATEPLSLDPPTPAKKPDDATEDAPEADNDDDEDELSVEDLKALIYGVRRGKQAA